MAITTPDFLKEEYAKVGSEVRSFREKFCLNAEEVAALLGIGYSEARTIIRGAAPGPVVAGRLKSNLVRLKNAKTRSDLKVPDFPV